MVSPLPEPQHDLSSISGDDLAIFRKKMLRWYSVHGRFFPWRKKSVSKFQVIIAEILLQRTRAETVANFFRNFVKKYPSWVKLSQASQKDLEKFLKPIGLWRRRASSLRSLTGEMVKRRGRFPKTRQEIESLPGIGQYIANAILLFCHDKPYPLLDVNMARVLERIFGPRKLADIRYDPYLQELSSKIVDCDKPREVNWAILDLAASTCKVKNPKCQGCPFFEICSFAKRNELMD